MKYERVYFVVLQESCVTEYYLKSTQENANYSPMHSVVSSVTPNKFQISNFKFTNFLSQPGPIQYIQIAP